MFKVRTADRLCAKGGLRDLKPKLLCGSGTAERQVASQYISCVEVKLRNFQALLLVRKRNCGPYMSHNILCAEAKLRNLKSQYIPSAEAELRYRII